MRSSNKCYVVAKEQREARDIANLRPLIDECSAIHHEQSSEKLEDPRNFRLSHSDVVVSVDRFTFSGGFCVVNFEIEHEMSIILGRPFLRTAKALIDLYEKTLTFKVMIDSTIKKGLVMKRILKLIQIPLLNLIKFRIYAPESLFDEMVGKGNVGIKNSNVALWKYLLTLRGYFDSEGEGKLFLINLLVDDASHNIAFRSDFRS
ncbi:reverse transcriptase domain-containing protein [Tanacetum coccineum]